MSDTPTFANLLTQWSTGGPAVREGIYTHLRACPAEAAAVEAFLRDELNAALPGRRVIAAEAMVEVYRDEDVAVTALAWVLRRDDSAATDSITVMRKLAPERAGPLIADFALYAPSEFRRLAPKDHKWAGATAVRSGARGAELWLAILGHAGPQTESALLMGLADGAGHATGDLSATRETVRARLFHTESGYAAGAALWRLTWRINRDWLASIDPHSPRFENDAFMLVLLIEVLVEHLGRRPDLAPLVRELLVRLGADCSDFRLLVQRLARFGARGWAVLLPVLGDAAVPSPTRAAVFDHAVKQAAVWPLAHHHAHNVILERTHDRSAVTPELLRSAAGMLTSLGATAGSATPDVLDLIVKQPDTAPVLTPVLPAIATGFPNPAAVVARTLDRLRRSVVFAPDAFAVLADVYAAMNLDGATALIEDTSLDPRTLESLFQQPAWKSAAPETRRRHALGLANSLGSPRPEVRARAAGALRQYPDQVPAVWHALVALLAGSDEKAVQLVLPLFRHLASVTDDVTKELRDLFREPRPTVAARAVVALGRLGRMPLVAPELCEAVVSTKGAAWGWAVLHGVVDHVVQAHGLLHDLALVFAGASPEIVAKVNALLYPPESDEESAIAVHVPRPDDPISPQMVDWNGVYRCVGGAPEGGLLFIALMCAFGSNGFAAQKIWLIKHQRALAGTGLADAKGIVERAIDRLTATATPSEKRACVRDYFYHTATLPKDIIDLLEHRVSWYRWAGLELLDTWGAPGRVAELIEDRIWDRSAFVRARALRMNQE